jgi:arylsulfatase A
MQPKPADLEQVSQIDDPLRRSFAAKVVGMDASIGRLLDTIDDLSMRENTLVIFMTDHGGAIDYGGSNLPLRAGKATLFEGGLRVPCIVRWPGHIPAGAVSDDVTCAIDWFATFGEIVGFETERLDGASMLASLKVESTERSRRLVWKTGAHHLLGRESWRAVREGDWKWVLPPGQDGMLFDLKSDPGENTDLAAKHPEVAKRLAGLVP